MRDQTEESRPVRGRQSENTGGRSANESTAPDALHAAVALERGDHALLVTRRIANGGIRRRVMLSLGSAERAVRQAEKAGQPATITLIRLVPVGHVSLEDEGGGV